MDLVAAFLLGIAGSVHCIGMCGPIALALPSRTSASVIATLMDRFTYNGGRLVTYASMGAVIGFGSTIFVLSGYSRGVSILSGSMMIAMAIAQVAWHRNLLPSAWTHRISAPVRRALSNSIATRGRTAMFTIGLLNGLLPCGLVTTALVGTVASGSALQGMLFMAMFGLGTLPSMLLVSMGASFVTSSMRHHIRYAAPVLTILVGAVIIVRGMDLGIPYLSPKAPTMYQSDSSSSSCCNHP